MKEENARRIETEWKEVGAETKGKEEKKIEKGK